MFIEINAHQSHNKHLFDENDDQNGVLLDGPVSQQDLVTLLMPGCEKDFSDFLPLQNHLRLI